MACLLLGSCLEHLFFCLQVLPKEHILTNWTRLFQGPNILFCQQLMALLNLSQFHRDTLLSLLHSVSTIVCLGEKHLIFMIKLSLLQHLCLFNDAFTVQFFIPTQLFLFQLMISGQPTYVFTSNSSCYIVLVLCGRAESVDCVVF